MATRVTDGARRERRSRVRALLSLNLKKKRDCSQSRLPDDPDFRSSGFPCLRLSTFPLYLPTCTRLNGRYSEVVALKSQFSDPK